MLEEFYKIKYFDELEESLLTALANKKIHVRGAEKVLQHFRERAFQAFYENKIDAYTLNVELLNIKRIEDRVHEEFHDYVVNHRRITLPKDEVLHAEGFAVR